jgi:nucleoside-diphosphate-sugar epimerase
VLRATKAAGVERFVHVGTEAALFAGQPLVNADESAPLRPDSKSLYPATKAKAEQAVRDASTDGFATAAVRPRFVWGPDDATVLPTLVDMVKKGKFAFIGGGKHKTSTTHVDNAVEGFVLAADKARPGAAYFVTDGDTIVFRDWITKLLATQGVEAPDKSVPKPVAGALAAGGESAWKLLRRYDSPPPLTRMAFWVSANECTLDDSAARRELGYVPVITREQGLADMSEQPG